MSNGKKLSGKCLCGAMHYSVTDDFEYAMNCHCSNCRRATGSAYKAFAGIKRDELNITQGADNILKYGEDIDFDIHCKACGSLLYSVVRGGQYVHVAMGTLIDTPSIRPTQHIYVGSKAPWHEITDNLPQFDELP